MPAHLLLLQINVSHSAFALCANLRIEPEHVNELPHDNSENSKTFIEKFQSFIHGADVLIHDAQYNLEEYKQREGWGHTNWEKLIELTKDSQIKQLYLTHHDPDNSDADLQKRCDQIQAEYESVYELVTLARDEMVVELP